ncbi:unnamed protein product [Absidia cylindrospora]
MESVLHPSSLHFLSEIYPNNSLTLFFGKQPPESGTTTTTTMKDTGLRTRLEDKKKQRRQSLPAPTISSDAYNDGDDYQDKDLLTKRYQRWSWTASSTVLPMETIQEEDE